MDIIGWLGVCIGVVVPLPQLVRIFKTGKVANISVLTYALLVVTISCYLLHAIKIGDAVFTVSNAFNLLTNSLVLIMLIRGRYDGGR
ncbi:SemiSWEET family sugar transporter [Dehalococcoides mccartyi]|uniref:SemiSWEET family sugar transporter n=1 Tax=Dehalococcoides mccartyi TaxID=61435 RepID=UPI00339250A7